MTAAVERRPFSAFSGRPIVRPSAADAFKDTSPEAPLVFVTITARATELDATARLASVYGRFFEGPATSGPAGLTGRALTPDSGYRGEVVYFTPNQQAPFVTRCLAE